MLPIFAQLNTPPSPVNAARKGLDAAAIAFNKSVYDQALDVAAMGDNVLVAGYPGLQIVVLAWHLSAAGAVNAKFKSSGGTQVSGTKTLAAAGSSASAEFSRFGHFRTAVGEGLNLNLSGAVSVGADVTYAVVTP